MISQTSITSLLFILLLFILLPSSTAYFFDYEIPDCNFNNDTYTENSEYQHMLELLLKRLNISTPAVGYSIDVSYSINRTNDVHGFAMCRGDLELPQDCSPCIQHAVSEIGKLCPYMKNAAVFYDHCYLHYGNETFKGNEMGVNHTFRWNINNITKVNRERFYKVREKLFSELLVEATNGKSSTKFFAAGEDSVSSDLSVFGLLQCIPDLATKQCKTCLDYHIKYLPEYAGFSAGFLSIGYSCFLRYENKLFYTKPTQPPSPPSSPSPSPPSDDNEGNKLSTWKIIIIVASLVMGLTLIFSLIGFGIWPKKKDKIDERGLVNEDKKLVRNVEYLSMKFEDLDIATNHFSQENKIGRGGFGFVYKGILDDREIAVKRLIDKDSLQGPDQLEKEVNLLAGLQHKNLVSLYGYCIERGEMLLVYEYMPNGSLEKHLFDPTPSMGVLNWNSRLNIIDGILKGIQYLHEDSRLKIFHCDLKPENILLDSNMTPKISDFGISKFFDVNQTRECTTINIVGTSGYMAPEYRFFGNFSTKSDMYSLGVMLIEILTGKRWSRQINSCEKANNLKSNLVAYWKNVSFADKLDKNISEIYNTNQETTLSDILHIAMLCIEYDPESRPKISEVRDFIKISNKTSNGSDGSNYNVKSNTANPTISATTENCNEDLTNDGVEQYTGNKPV